MEGDQMTDNSEQLLQDTTLDNNIESANDSNPQDDLESKDVQKTMKDQSVTEQISSNPVPTETQQGAINAASEKSTPTPTTDPVTSEPPATWNQIPNQPQKLDVLINTIRKNPWDSDAREKLIAEALRTNNASEVRSAFKKFLDQFPSCTRVWIQYLEYERNLSAWDEIEKIFHQCLRSVPSVALYQYYIDYIKHIHTAENSGLENAKETQSVITKAYDFVLNTIGTDKDSGFLWMEYIQFVKNSQTISSYEEQQKMDLLRKIFHKAIHTPLQNIEDIWKEYDTFENQLSKLTAKKFISDQAAGYMTARGANRDLKTLLEPIEKIEEVWVPKPPTWQHSQIKLLNLWKRYISWERSNPLHLADKNHLILRVTYAYKSALLMLHYFPELWYDAATYLLESEKSDDAISILRSGIQANPSSLLLTFTLAEVLESKKYDFKEIQTLFDTLIAKLEDDVKDINKSFDLQKKDLEKQLKETMVLEELDEDEGEQREREREMLKEQEKEIYQRIEVPRQEKLDQLKQASSLVWIIYMRLTRRSQNIRAARLVFGKARKSTFITSHVFISSALMEYYVNKDPVVAGKIFELGLKSFPIAEDPQAAEYVLHYLDFLMCLNDDNNTRALFERALSTIPTERSKLIWQKYLDYETQYGDLTNLYRIEKRFTDVFASGDVNSHESVVKIASKWSYFDINYVGKVELGLDHLALIPRLAPPAAQVKLGASGNLDRRDDKGRQTAMLGGINIDLYPRPDFTKWTSYKSEPGVAKTRPIKMIPDEGIVIPVTEPNSSGFMVPAPIAAFMSLIPTKEMYNGPPLNAIELIAQILKVNLPPPSICQTVPAPPGYNDPLNRGQKRVGKWDNDENRKHHRSD
ncbi:hypothetical protein BC833DRAFT_649433 [Globomyces pollinis-pini]|nr:hypothetical protein BC833DRAFT_649433 [Globomyces pollinis-pini]